MLRKISYWLFLLCVFLVTLSLGTGWPWDHAFATYHWWGPLGWVARETPGNIVAGFIQVSLAFMAGCLAHKAGVFERIKGWLFKEAAAEKKRAMEHDEWVAHVMADMHRKVTGEDPKTHPHHGDI